MKLALVFISGGVLGVLWGEGLQLISPTSDWGAAQWAILLMGSLVLGWGWGSFLGRHL